MAKIDLSTTPSENATNLVCVNCVHDYYLKSKIYRESKGRCSYCKKVEKVTTIEKLSTCIVQMLEKHYKKVEGADDSRLEPRKEGVDSARVAEQGNDIRWIIEETAGVKEEISTDLQNHMDRNYKGKYKSAEKSPYNKDTLYTPTERDDMNSRDLWEEFKACIKEENDSRDDEILKSIFYDSSDLPIVKINPDTAPYHLFRARVFQSQEDMINALRNLEIQLGPPPVKEAKAGRLNTDNVPMFYGSEDLDTTISEVRSFVGNIVVIACFKVIRSLRLLDIETLGAENSQLSLYDPSYESPSDREQFIFNLIKSISAPVLPGKESIDYSPTQRISNYLSSPNGLDIDGVMYKSTQSAKGGNNVALFHNSSRVEGYDNTANNVVQAYTYHDGPEIRVGYIVHREISRNSESSTGIVDSDDRTSALRLDDSNIFVHSITGTKFDTIKEKIDVIHNQPTRQSEHA